MDPQTVVAIVVPTVTVIVWLVKQEGRISSHDREIGDVKGDVRYIRERIDRALNGKHE
jgi:hypothetical protein